MSASKVAKSCGFKSLAELAELAGYTTAHMHNIFRDDKSRFELLIRRALGVKVDRNFGATINSTHFLKVQ